MPLRPAVITSPGPDSIVGTPGDDTLAGGAGNDTVRGGAGNDFINGNADDDRLFGDDGNDRIVGGGGLDVIDGGAGNDTLVGGNGSTMVGGDGNDRFETGWYDGGFTITTGAGSDFILVSRDEPGQGNAPMSSPMFVTDFDYAAGDRIVFNWQEWHGVWRIAPDAGFTGQYGFELELAGSIMAWYDAARDVTMFYHDRNWNGTVDGVDLRIDFAGNVAASWKWLYWLVERAGTDAAETSATMELGDGTDWVHGMGGNDSLDAAAGNDFVSGDAGNDTLAGGLGEDVLYGGYGNDSLSGGDGNDLLAAADSADDAGATTNWLAGDAGNDSLHGASAVDHLAGGADNDTINGSGGNDILDGGTGDDTLHGEHGHDLLQGGAGNDLLIVGAGVAGGAADFGRDTAVGGDGNDRFELGGGSGAVLTGGAGADRYVLLGLYQGTDASVANPLVFTDFDIAGGDRLEFQLDAYGDARATVWRGAAAPAFSGAIGQSLALAGAASDARFRDLWTFVDASTGRTVLFGDRNDDGLVDAGDLRLEFAAGTVIGGEMFAAPHALRYQVGTEGDDAATLQPLDAGDNHAFALGGNDTLDGGAGFDVLNGDAGDDVLAGGADGDRLNGGAGNDTLHGGDGNDFLDVGASVDTAASRNEAHGGAGADGLGGSAGVDVLYGEGDNDSIRAGAGNDTADGGTGNDALFGEDGDDVLLGGTGGDNLAGGNGADLLDGGDGNDVLNGHAGADTLIGGLGNDTYTIDADDAIVEAANAGIDTIVSALDTWTLGAVFENLTLVGGADGVGNSLANLIASGSGDNAIDGGAGADTVSYAGAIGGVTVWLALVTAQATGGSGNDSLVNIENLVGSGHDDTLSGNALANLLDGGLWNDTLNGGGGNDSLLGGDHDDVLDGGAGNDRIDGGLHFFKGDTVTYANATAGVNVNLALTTQDTGGAGIDTLIYLEHVIGSAYADALRGNGGRNRIEAGNGSDWILGGGGADTLGGGIGADVFVFASAADSTLAAMDTLLDFNRFQGDKLDVSRIDANATLAGNQAFTFIGAAAFGADATGQLRYDGGIVYGSVDADADAEFAIALTGMPAVVAGSFLL